MYIREDYETVVSTLCLCDVKEYIKAKEGKVVFPRKYYGRPLGEVLDSIGGFKILSERGGYTHVFVVGSRALVKMATRPATLAQRVAT